MTPAGTAPPLTAQALLAEGPEFPAAIARGLLSIQVAGNLGGLDRLPAATRAAVGREVTATTAGLLDVNLIGALVAGWRAHHDLRSAARRTLDVPGSKEVVGLADHEVTATQKPTVAVLVDGSLVATLHLGLTLVFNVTGLLAGVSGGRLVALHTGRCDVTATLAIEGADALTKRITLELPGAVPLSPGIWLAGGQDRQAGHEPGWATGTGADGASQWPGSGDVTVPGLPVPQPRRS